MEPVSTFRHRHLMETEDFPLESLIVRPEPGSPGPDLEMLLEAERLRGTLRIH